jgi:hypothetical protein
LACDGIEIHVIDKTDAKEFLYKCSKTGSEEDNNAVALVIDLGRLPLAIEQAGGFI